MNRKLVGGLMATMLAASAIAGASSVAGAADPTPAKSSPNSALGLKPAAQQQLVRSATAQAPAVRESLGLTADQELVVKNVLRDRSGATHVRYERTFKGLRVIGGDFVVHNAASGARDSVTWNASGKAAVASVTPKISLATAKAKGSSTFAKTDATKKAQPAGELVVYAGGAAPVLAYDVVTEGVKADQTPSRLHTIVDARTGATLVSFDEIHTGDGNGIFVGQVAIGTKAKSGGGFEMTDTVGNTTTDLNNSTSGNGTTFTDPDDTWGNGTQSNRQSAGVDAHYGAGKTFDYYKNTLGRNGIWNDGRGARSRVHYGNSYVNAFWDGTQMTYGDGQNNAAPLVELDVAGHEMSHGVTENTAGLNYFGDAGGLNESTSDIFGTAVEFYANNAQDIPDYLIGEEIDIRGNGTPLRYMDKPSKDGQSVDCWSSSTGGMDPHYSSGPLNHWFFLASEGSGAKVINGVSYNSPTCDGSTITGIGRDKAEKVWYRTLSTYLTSSSNYAAARNGAIKSAKDLFPTDTAVCQGVAAAFSAISVPAGSETCGSTPNPGDVKVASPGNKTGTVGTAIGNITLSATGGTAPYTWSATGLPAGLSVSSAGVISGTPTAAATASVTVTARDASSPVKSGTATFTFTVSPAGGGTCQGEIVKTGTLSRGQSVNQASFTDSDAGQLKVCLDGPAGADFDVYLQKRQSGLYWATVAQGTSPDADEAFTYNNTAGTYRLVVKAYSGSGAFTTSISE